MIKLHRLLTLGLVLLAVGAATSHGQEIQSRPYGSWQTEGKHRITSLAFSLDGNLLAAGDKSGGISCWDLEQKKLLQTLKARDDVRFLDFVDDGKSVVVVDGSGNVAVLPLIGGPAELSFRTRSDPVGAALDAGRRLLAVATKSGSIELYDLKARMPAGTIDARGRIDDLLFLGFDRRGETLVAIPEDGKVASWDPSTQALSRELTLQGGGLHGSQSVVHCAATNRAANLFVVGLQEVALPRGGASGGLVRQNSVIVYDWESGSEIKRVKLDAVADGMALGPGNDHVAIMNQDSQNMTLLDLRKGEIRHQVHLEEKPEVLAVAGNDRWLASGSHDGQVSVWSLEFQEPNPAASGSPDHKMSGRIRSLSGEDPALTPENPVTLAILPLEAKGLPSNVSDICLDVMSARLANVKYVTLVERQRIQDIISQLKLPMMGLTEENGAEVGKLLNAKVVLLGSVGTLGTSYVFSVRLLEVETGKVIGGRQVVCEECRDQDILDAVTLLTSIIAR